MLILKLVTETPFLSLNVKPCWVSITCWIIWERQSLAELQFRATPEQKQLKQPCGFCSVRPKCPSRHWSQRSPWQLAYSFRNFYKKTQKFTCFNSFRYTLQEQERPSGQSGRRDPRGSQEQVGGRPPSGRQSLEVPNVASPVYPSSQSSHSSPVVWSRQFMQTPESGSHSFEWPLQLQGSQSPK
jgi:hypothetical protein